MEGPGVDAPPRHQFGTDPPDYDHRLDALSVRARNCLLRAGIRSIETLRAKSIAELSAIRNMGELSVSEIGAFLAKEPDWDGPVDQPNTTIPSEVEFTSGPLESSETLLEARLTAEVASGLLFDGLNFPRYSSDLTVAGFLQTHSLGEGAARDLPLVLASLASATVDREGAELLACLSLRELSVLRERYRLDGRRTLQQIGVEQGVTRERIRQIQEKAEKRLRTRAARRPLLRLRSAAHFARGRFEWEGIEGVFEDLHARGLCQTPRGFEDFLLAWQVVGLDGGLPRDFLLSARDGSSPAQMRLKSKISPVARQMCRNSGAVRLESLASYGAESDLRAALGSLGFEELRPSWFWCDVPAKNVVATVARKVFSVCRRVTVRDFRLSLSHHLSRREFPTPPTAVLYQVALKLDFVRPEGDWLVRTRAFDPTVELNGSELVLYHLFTERYPVATFQELFDANRDAGYKSVTLSDRLRRSPIIRKVRHGIYSLVGCTVSESDVTDALTRVPQVDANPTIAYGIDGTVVFSINAGTWLFYAGVLGTSLLEPFQGEWSLGDGTSISVGPQFVWGLEQSIANLDVQLGGRISITLNTWSRTVSVASVST